MCERIYFIYIDLVMNVIFVLYHPSELTNWVVKLLPYLDECHVSVFHIASLHHVETKKISGVDLYDISKKSYKNLVSLIDMINPAKVVFLSFRSLMELVLQRICMGLGIRTFYLEHGLFSNDTLRFRVNKLRKEWGCVFRRQWCFWKLSFECILHSSSKVKEVSLFYRVYKQGRFYLCPFDFYYLFSMRSYEMMTKVYRIRLGVNVELVGYPIFVDSRQKKLSETAISTNGGVLYVHQPLISDGLASISYEEEKEYLVEIANKVNEHYGSLTILLHPRSDVDEYRKRFRNTGINVIQSPNNFLLFADKALIIGHYSTALLYGLYFEKPTIVLDYPTTRNDSSFNQFFTYIKRIDDLDKMSVECCSRDSKTYMLGSINTFEYIARRLTNGG